MIKSQVLTGGRMKAGGVKFADTPDEAAAHAEEILKLEINGHMPRGVLVDPKAEVKQEYYAGVVWDGTAKQPLMLFSDMGGIDIEEVAETHPDHVGRGHVSNLLPISDFEAKQVVAATGRHRLAAQPRDPDPRPPRPPLPRLRHDPGRDQPAGRAHRRQLRRPRRPHGDGERGGRPPEEAAAQAARRSPRTTPARPTSPPTSSATSPAIDAADHRGVIQGKDHGFEGNLGLVIGAGGGSLTLTDAVRSQGGKPANYSEIGGNPSVAKACGLAKEVLEKDGVEKIAVMMSIVSNTRVDIVARGVIKACLELGKDPGETIAIFRIPGAWEEEGFKILDRYGVEYCDRSVSMWEAAGDAPSPRSREARRMSILLNKDTTFIVQGITGREAVNLTRECLDYGSKVVGGVTPGRKGREVHGVPVFDTVAQAVENHGGPIDGSVVTVPPAFTKDAVLEAIENGIKLIVIVTERIPRRDVAQMVELADDARRPDHRPQLPRPDRPRGLQDGRHRRPGQGRRQGLRPRPGRRDVAARAG